MVMLDYVPFICIIQDGPTYKNDWEMGTFCWWAGRVSIYASTSRSWTMKAENSKQLKRPSTEGSRNNNDN